jgi:hypothetical protein
MAGLPGRLGARPALPDPRAAEGLPSHPTLWAARQRQPTRKHCARAAAARPTGAPKRIRDARSRARTPRALPRPCPCCGGRMFIIETFARGSEPKHRRSRRPRSGSTPHDAVIADPAPHRSAPFWPALAWQHTRLRRSARLARDRTANPVEQPAIRSFTPARTPKIRAKAIRSPASAQLPQHSRRRQIPIAPAALSVPHTPRFRALALFGRRLSERGDGPGMPASENLHIRRPCCARLK